MPQGHSRSPTSWRWHAPLSVDATRGQDATENPGAWLRRKRADEGAINRLLAGCDASALNADIDSSLCLMRQVIRELFMNSARAGSMGMSTVRSAILCGCCGFPCRARLRPSAQFECGGGGVGHERISMDIRTREANVHPGFLVLALPFEADSEAAFNTCLRPRV